jgi:Co/Zn/Cd efflux system component
MFRKRSGKVDMAARALAAAAGVAHVAFFTLFAWRVVGRGGIGAVGWALLALVALLGLVTNLVGYWLVKHGGRTVARRWGYIAIGASNAVAGVLLGIASWTS